MKLSLPLTLLAASLSLVCHAQTPAPVPQNLLACSKLQDAAERVRCYDAQIAAMSSASTPAAAATSRSPTPTPSPAPAQAPAPAAAASATSPAPRAPVPTVAPATAAPSASAPAAVESAHAAPVAPAAPVSAAPQAPAVASERARAEQFGQEELPQAARPAKHQEEESLSSRITALNAVGANKYLISLENGQVWRQKESDHVATFYHVGDDVRIEKGMLGSYRLWTVSTGQKNWIAVLRMR